MCAMTDPAELIERLADQLTVSGDLTDQRWRAAMHAVPRHLFVPARAYASPSTITGPEARAIDRDLDAADWYEAVYTTTSIITQRDDGAGDATGSTGRPTCSVSGPDVVVQFLELLDPRPGQRVLEIGTGTGWTAALLAHVLGDSNVTSVEIDPALMAVAAANLRAAGHAPLLVTADGAAGHAAGAPYDGIHITCGIARIPDGLIRQLRPGGTAVLPWAPSGPYGHKLKLSAVGDGTAVGTIRGRANYMMLRSQRLSDVMWHPRHADEADTTWTDLDPREVANAGAGADFAITVAAPGVHVLPHPEEDGSLSLLVAEVGNADGCWAACDSSEDGRHVVTQYGPRRLWDEVEDVYRRWLAHGRPPAERLGLLIEPDGQQHLWLDEPSRVL